MDKPDLGSVPLFSGLATEALEALQAELEEIRLGPGQTLTDAGAKADSVYVIAQGWVRLVDAAGKDLARLGPGSLIGEADALGEADYSVGARAVTQALAWALPTAAVARVARRFPSLLLVLEASLGFRPRAAVQGFAQWLADSGEFGDASPEDLERLAENMQSVSLGAGEQLASGGEPGLVVVERGSVEVSEGEGEPVEKQGCFLIADRRSLAGGEASLAARTTGETFAWYLSRDLCQQLKAEGVGVVSRLMEKAAETAMAPSVTAAEAEAVPVEAEEEATLREPLLALIEAEPVSRALVIARPPAPKVKFGAWLAGLSGGAKLRLAVSLLLVVWVIAALASTLLAAAAPAQQPPQRDLSQARATAVARTPGILALALTATPTFAPSPTAAPTNTPAPTATPAPTDTPVPTATNAPTDTPVPPTETPEPTNTPKPRAMNTPEPPPAAIAEENQAAPEAFPTDTPVPAEPTATPVPASSSTYRVAGWRQLTPCENHGMHNIFINVIDAAGNGIPSVPLEVNWGGGSAQVVTGQKMEMGPGWAVFDMFKGTYWVKVLDGSSETTPALTVDIWHDEACGDNPIANSTFHYSYEVVFQRSY